MAVLTKKIRILERQGDPSSGAILQAGSVVPIPVFWADKWIAAGIAVEVKEEAEKAVKAEKKKK
jgi:hypothetical protein